MRGEWWVEDDGGRQECRFLENFDSWNVDDAKIPFIELDMFTGTSAIHTRYFVVCLTWLDPCSLRLT